MAILDNLEPEESEYKFTDGKIDDFIEELGQDKQDMGIDYEPELEEEEEEDPIRGSDDEPTATPTVNMHQAKSISKGLVIGGDALIASAMGMMNGGDAEPFKLSDEERQQVTTSLAIVLKEKNANVSPIWGLVILLFTIYGGKSLILVQLNKERKKNSELENELNNAKKQLEEWKSERQD